MKEKINKTNVARLLDKAKVVYKLVPYEVDENDLSATHVAEQLGEDVSQVFKTLVLRGDKSGYFVCVIPGSAEVNLKKAAKEEAFPHLYSGISNRIRTYLCQCRATWPASLSFSG